jgi:hypothetical protein
VKNKKINLRYFEKYGDCDQVKRWFAELPKKEYDPFDYAKILLKEKKYADLNTGLTREMNKRQLVQYAVYAAKLVVKYDTVTNEESKACIVAAEAYIKNQSFKNRDAARAAAWDARTAARAAAWDAGAAARAAGTAAWAAAGAAAWDAARAAAENAAWAAAGNATWTAAWDADWAAVYKKILNYGIKILKGKVK